MKRMNLSKKSECQKIARLAKWGANLASTGTELGGKVADATRSLAGTINKQTHKLFSRSKDVKDEKQTEAKDAQNGESEFAEG